MDLLRKTAGIALQAATGARDYLDLRRSWREGTCPATLPILYLEVIKRCNLRCGHCGFPTGYPARGRVLTTGEIRSLLDESVRLNTRIVSFGGGEPFLRKDLQGLLSYGDQLGLSMHVDTNGTLVDENLARGLDALKRLTLVTSLEHPDAGRNDEVRGDGVHAKVARAVELVRRHAPRVRVGINCVITPLNLDSLASMVELGARWGVNAVQFTPAHGNLNHGFGPGDLDHRYVLTTAHAAPLALEIERVLDRASRLGLGTSSAPYLRNIPAWLRGRSMPTCYAGFVYANIDPYGFLFPCYDHRESINVRREGLASAWKSPQMQRMRQAVRACTHRCWNTGNAEPSLRMEPVNLMRHPEQILHDLRFYFR